MRAAVTERLWRVAQACRGNPTSCLRQDVMRVVGVRVREEMTGSQLAIANTRKRSEFAHVTHVLLVYNYW